MLENTESQNAKYSQCECVKVIGIPKQIELKNLEDTVYKIFNSIGFDIGEDRIEACDRHYL